MKIRTIKLILILFAASQFINAQTIVDLKNSFDKKEYTKVLEMLPKLMKLKPKDASLNLYKAQSLYELGDKTKSEADFLVAAKGNLAPAFFYLGEMEYYNYQFEKSVDDLSRYLAHPKADTLQKDRAKQLLAWAEVGRRLIKGVEKVQVIDSVVVDKASFMNEYHLSPEAGTVQSSKSVFQHDTTAFASLFINQKNDRIIFARRTEDQGLDLFSKSRLIEKWSERTNLGNVVNSSFDENYPFMLSDGVTLYYSSNRPGSMGGHDIFVTRYNLAEENYLAPENIGMPFNSIYNDYLLAIDETNDIGWFASDRYQPKGKVVVYLFIPNDEKQIVTNVTPQRAIQLATLQSIKLTWQKKANYAPILQKVHQIKIDSISSGSEMAQMYFVINDATVYRSISQFKSADARETYLKLQNNTFELENDIDRINLLRKEYGGATKERKAELSKIILPLETKIETSKTKIAELSNKIRQLELKTKNLN